LLQGKFLEITKLNLAPIYILIAQIYFAQQKAKKAIYFSSKASNFCIQALSKFLPKNMNINFNDTNYNYENFNCGSIKTGKIIKKYVL